MIKIPIIETLSGLIGVPFVLTGLTLLGFSAAAGFAGTSVLFSAYLAGVSTSYLCHDPAQQCYEL